MFGFFSGVKRVEGFKVLGSLEGTLNSWLPEGLRKLELSRAGGAWGKVVFRVQ